MTTLAFEVLTLSFKCIRLKEGALDYSIVNPATWMAESHITQWGETNVRLLTQFVLWHQSEVGNELFSTPGRPRFLKIDTVLEYWAGF